MPQKKDEHHDNLTKAARTLGEKGGLRGGPARAKKLSATRRSAIARQGGLARQRKGKG